MILILMQPFLLSLSIMMSGIVVSMLAVASVHGEISNRFEYPECDWETQMVCPGKWSEDWTEQLTNDTCMPMKDGECWNYCPDHCHEGDMTCPGKTYGDGCVEPDFCHHGSKFQESLNRSI